MKQEEQQRNQQAAGAPLADSGATETGPADATTAARAATPVVPPADTGVSDAAVAPTATPVVPPAETIPPAETAPPDLTPFQENWVRLRQNKGAVAGLVIIVAFVIVAIFAPLLAPADPLAQNIDIRKSAPFEGNGFLGTDDLGRDLLSRIMYGARVSMTIGIVSVGIAAAGGIAIGTASGFYGGIFDKIVQRLVDIMLSFPYVLLTIVIVAVLGPSLTNAMIAIGISQMPRYVRLVRAQVLSEKEADYVLAERSLGTGDLELMFGSILPNSLAPVIVMATLGVGEAILSSAALSFLGLGAQPPTPEWGLMIASSREFVTSAWWIVTFPGIATLLAVLGFNLFGDGLRDVLDPRMKD